MTTREERRRLPREKIEFTILTNASCQGTHFQCVDHQIGTCTFFLPHNYRPILESTLKYLEGLEEDTRTNDLIILINIKLEKEIIDLKNVYKQI
jgi:hypothetical protein